MSTYCVEIRSTETRPDASPRRVVVPSSVVTVGQLRHQIGLNRLAAAVVVRVYDDQAQGYMVRGDDERLPIANGRVHIALQRAHSSAASQTSASGAAPRLSAQPSPLCPRPSAAQQQKRPAELTPRAAQLEPSLHAKRSRGAAVSGAAEFGAVDTAALSSRHAAAAHTSSYSPNPPVPVFGRGSPQTGCTPPPRAATTELLDARGGARLAPGDWPVPVTRSLSAPPCGAAAGFFHGRTDACDYPLNTLHARPHLGHSAAELVRLSELL
jgi:hypothetical protein